MPFARLNIPPADVSVRPSAGGYEIFDPLRGRWVELTPEEWVRQHFSAWLIASKGFPRSLMANEVGITLNGLRRRCDTIAYDRTLRPAVVVEYKAPAVNLSQRVFDQIARYNMVLKARVLIVSNGLSHYCCRYTDDGYVFMSYVPDFSEVEAIQNS
ncbi:MAG: type I restriction enzyme HsdR N-terminal domain-containing protein [Barnesiella sp.]|nr:type I restriction enzyme HsdR N-terminal domain-containing protein [Barnesiella sp.]